MEESANMTHSIIIEMFEPVEAEALKFLVTVGGTLSAVGCLLSIFSYFLFKEYKMFHMRLILYLIIADFLGACSSIFGSQIRGPELGKLYCQVSAAGLETFLLSAMLWTGCIAHTLDQVIRKRNFNIERYEPLYHIVCWGIPIGSDVYLWMTNRFGDAGLWCWVTEDEHGLFRFAFFYGIVGFVFVYNSVIYFLVSCQLNREKQRILQVIDDEKEHTIQTTFRWFLLAMFICWVPAIANRIQNVVQPGIPIFGLYCLHAIFVPLQGFFDSIIYGFNDEIRANYTKLCAGCCSCCPSNDYEPVVLNVQDEEQWNQIYKDAMSEYENT